MYAGQEKYGLRSAWSEWCRQIYIDENVSWDYPADGGTDFIRGRKLKPQVPVSDWFPD